LVQKSVATIHFSAPNNVFFIPQHNKKDITKLFQQNFVQKSVV